MSHLEFKSYAGTGQYNRQNFHYSQSVRVGDMVYISGQGGWQNGDVVYGWKDGVEAQIRQAFINVEIALNEAGAKMENVFKLVTYTVDFKPEYNDVYVKEMRKAWPNHAPLWTDLSVPVLGDPKMLVEVEVIAHIPAGQGA